MTSTPDADARLLDAHDLALAALHEITPPSTVGPAAGYTVEDGGALSLRFENTMAGYPGWFWTVSVAVVDDAEPTVLEAELLPGEGALLAPDWVPWAVRLAEYQATQAALAAEEGDAGDDADDLDDEEDDDSDEQDIDDLDDLDAADFDQDGSPILHAGDVDGVDIDVLDEHDDEGADDEDAADDDEDDSDDENDSDDQDDSADDDDTGR